MDRRRVRTIAELREIRPGLRRYGRASGRRATSRPSPDAWRSTTPHVEEFDVPEIAPQREVRDRRILEPSFVDERRHRMLIEKLRRARLGPHLDRPQIGRQQWYADPGGIRPSGPGLPRGVGQGLGLRAVVEDSLDLGEPVPALRGVCVPDIRKTSSATSSRMRAAPRRAQEQQAQARVVGSISSLSERRSLRWTIASPSSMIRPSRFRPRRRISCPARSRWLFHHFRSTVTPSSSTCRSNERARHHSEHACGGSNPWSYGCILWTLPRVSGDSGAGHARGADLFATCNSRGASTTARGNRWTGTTRR